MESPSALSRLAGWPLLAPLIGLAAVVASQHGDPTTAGVLASAAGPIADVSAGLESITQRRAERKKRRVEEVMLVASAKLGPDAKPASESVDLAAEVLGAVLADDDEQKTPFYGWLLTLAMSPDPNRTQLVLLVQAVRTLTYVELYALAHEVGTSRVPQSVLDAAGLSPEAYGTRLHNAALRDRPPTGVTVGAIGRLAERLISGVDLSSLPAPRDAQS